MPVGWEPRGARRAWYQHCVQAQESPIHCVSVPDATGREAVCGSSASGLAAGAWQPAWPALLILRRKSGGSFIRRGRMAHFGQRCDAFCDAEIENQRFPPMNSGV